MDLIVSSKWFPGNDNILEKKNNNPLFLTHLLASLASGSGKSRESFGLDTSGIYLIREKQRKLHLQGQF